MPFIEHLILKKKSSLVSDFWNETSKIFTSGMKLSMKISAQNLVISKTYWSVKIGAAYNDMSSTVTVIGTANE